LVVVRLFRRSVLDAGRDGCCINITYVKLIHQCSCSATVTNILKIISCVLSCRPCIKLKELMDIYKHIITILFGICLHTCGWQQNIITTGMVFQEFRHVIHLFQHIIVSNSAYLTIGRHILMPFKIV
jgi:hypothetical protein